jgi:YD repeat-containing protein
MHRSVLPLLLACAAVACAAPPADAPQPPSRPAASPPDADPRRALAGVSRGELVPLERLLADAETRHPGRVLEVELEGDEYEIEILQADGHVVELTYDAHDGRLLETEIEND